MVNKSIILCISMLALSSAQLITVPRRIRGHHDTKVAAPTHQSSQRQHTQNDNTVISGRRASFNNLRSNKYVKKQQPQQHRQLSMSMMWVPMMSMGPTDEGSLPEEEVTTTTTTSTTTSTTTTFKPSKSPSKEPSLSPTTAEPTTSEPSKSPSSKPTNVPTVSPTTASPTTKAPSLSPTTSAPTNCENRKWYFHLLSGCSNIIRVNDESYDTLEQCCFKHYGPMLESCDFYDTCNPPTTSPSPRPSKSPTVPTSMPSEPQIAPPLPEEEPTSSDPCGNSVCEIGENPGQCPSDCVQKTANINSKADANSEGQMFTIEATTGKIGIEDFSILGKKDGEGEVMVYTRSGDYPDIEDYDYDAGWEVVYDKKIEVSKNELTDLGGLDRAIEIPAGSKQSFYIWSKKKMLNGKGKSEGNPFFSKGPLVVTEGISTKKWFSHSQGVGQFIGSIQYYESAQASPVQSDSPTSQPSDSPSTTSPTKSLTSKPSKSPSSSPTNGPTAKPVTDSPSKQPSQVPSQVPSQQPTTALVFTDTTCRDNSECSTGQSCHCRFNCLFCSDFTEENLAFFCGTCKEE